MPLRPDLKEILEKAILAPSADNLQPWKFVISQDAGTIKLYVDIQYVQNFCDTALLMPYLSCGAVIENIRVAASAFGYQSEIHYFPDPKNFYYVADIVLISSKVHQSSHFAALSRRVTNRKLYEGTRIPRSVFTKLSAIAAEQPGFKLLWIPRDDKRYGDLSKLIGDADQLRFECKRLHRELYQLMRMTRTAQEAKRDGLYLKTFEVSPPEAFTFKVISNWSILEWFNRLGLSRLFNAYARKQMFSSEAAGFIVAPTQAPVDYVKGGEIMQRIWHEITVSNLSLQPMEALPIFILNLQQGNSADFSAAQKKKLRELKDSFFSLFEIKDNHGLIFLFRTGFSKPVSARNLRRPLEEFIKSENDQ